MSKIVVTGGLGFIGSHTVVELLESGHEVLIIDNLSNSTSKVLDTIKQITGRMPKFKEGSYGDVELLASVFSSNTYDGVIHFAGYKAVGESCEDPFGYYQNNIVGTMNLLRMMEMHEVKNIIFSSSATVYDADAEEAPFHEDARTGNATNPYGTTKFVIEQLLKDMGNWKHMNVVCLRYFNPIGAHSTGLIGEDPKGIPNNLLPVMMEVLEGKREKLSVFGDTYDTPDGSCVRDYIHVVDLAQAHKLAREKIGIGYEVYNVGTGKGTSVLEMITLVEQVTGTVFPHKVVGSRDGDIGISVAHVDKIQKQLGRKASLTVQKAVEDAIRFRKNRE